MKVKVFDYLREASPSKGPAVYVVEGRLVVVSTPHDVTLHIGDGNGLVVAVELTPRELGVIITAAHEVME